MSQASTSYKFILFTMLNLEGAKTTLQVKQNFISKGTKEKNFGRKTPVSGKIYRFRSVPENVFRSNFGFSVFKI